MVDNVDFYLYDLKTKFDKITPSEYYLSYSGGVIVTCFIGL